MGAPLLQGNVAHELQAPQQVSQACARGIHTEASEPHVLAEACLHQYEESALMQLYITHLMETYFLPMREKLKLPVNQMFVLILDVYSAHRDSGFMAWVTSTYPMLILLFVPASFTPSTARRCREQCVERPPANWVT